MATVKRVSTSGSNKREKRGGEAHEYSQPLARDRAKNTRGPPGRGGAADFEKRRGKKETPSH